MAVKDFHHPYQPYDIQQQFMTSLYDCIERGGIGIFESPTGTGKSLSLICASLTWLREHKRKLYDASLAAIEIDDDEPEWMAEHARTAIKKELNQARTELEARLQLVRDQETKVKKQQSANKESLKRRKVAKDDLSGSNEDEQQFVLDDYNSSDERTAGSADSSRQYSLQTQALMEEIGLLPKPKQENEVEAPEELKVFFCSRTHSQLSQLVGELQRVRLPPSIPLEELNKNDTNEALKHVPLGSRKNLCINKNVVKLTDPTAINERCMELQKPNTSADRKCPYIPHGEDAATLLDFRDHTLARIRDIEDLAELGSKLGICPYYASRSALSLSEAVTLPYPLLLQKSARQALGISLKGHVVVIDEAHNILDAMEGIHSTQISNSQLQSAKESLLVYLQKFRNRLKGQNRVYVTQVVRVVDSLLSFLNSLDVKKDKSGSVIHGQLLSGKGLDQVNLVKLVTYIEKSKLARKVEGYINFKEEVQNSNTSRPSTRTSTTTPTLMQVQNFITTLMNPSKEGKFFWSHNAGTTTLRYILLDPSEHFREIVEEARAVILSGGTMSPMSDYIRQLVPYVDHVTTFSCGHLIPSNHLFVRTIISDQAGAFDFSFTGRGAITTAKRIGEALAQISEQVTGGMVVFFPSYGFLEQVLTAWSSSDVLTRLGKDKPIFFDKRGVQTDAFFAQYKDAVQTSSRGAIIFSVMGGKLSEGINFSDDLGRCVVVIGLPFPNLETPEWKAKIQHMDGKARAHQEDQRLGGSELAENACMRSVNQAIGRVIRHKNDWASILLIDQRYGQVRVSKKLPGWIRNALPPSRGLDDMSVQASLRGLGEFFYNRRKCL